MEKEDAVPSIEEMEKSFSEGVCPSCGAKWSLDKTMEIIDDFLLTKFRCRNCKVKIASKEKAPIRPGISELKVDDTVV